jgi:hypothetical protein
MQACKQYFSTSAVGAGLARDGLRVGVGLARDVQNG